MGYWTRKKKDSNSSVSVSSYGEVVPSREGTPNPRKSITSSVSEEKEVDIPAHVGSTDRRHQPRVSDISAPSVQVNVYPTASSPPTSAYYQPVVSSSYRNQPPKPTCTVCGLYGTREVTRYSNRNGNAGRRYWKCYPCGRFMKWDDNDDIGIVDTNPPCACGEPSRSNLSGKDKGQKVFYKCAAGKCDFFSFLKDENDVVQPGVTDEVADVLRKMRIA